MGLWQPSSSSTLCKGADRPAVLLFAHILLIINSPSGHVFYLLLLEMLRFRKPILEACNYTNLDKSPSSSFYPNLLKRGVFIFTLLLDLFDLLARRFGVVSEFCAVTNFVISCQESSISIPSG